VVRVTLPPDTLDTLTLLLQQTFGTRVQIKNYRVVNHHEDYWALIVRLREPSLAVSVKLAGPRAPHAYAFDRTAMFHQLVAARTSIRMPEIVGIDVSYQHWPWRTLIKTYLPGQEWAVVRPRLDQDELADAYRQIGTAVAELHQITFPGFGDITSDGTVQAETDFATALRTREQRFISSPRLIELALSVLESRAELLAPAEARLCHEDLHKYNLLFHRVKGRWTLATVLDFDKAWAGHHEIDLARMELWHEQTGAGFWPAYHALISTDPLYEQRRPVYQFLWCLEFAAPTPAHLADTQRLCQALGLPPITEFS
jgi:aminoglycoside phosphotransferase (APT) family kinase protein